MKCTYFNGMIDNPKYTCHEDYFRGIETRVKCKKCNGFGWIVTDKNEVLQELKDIKIGLEHKEKSNYIKRIENIINIIQNP